jgi:phage-related protein
VHEKASAGWDVDFFKNDNGTLPARSWMVDLPQEVRAKIIARVQVLREYGPALDFPYSSQIEGKLRELRLRIGKTRYRVLYFFDEKRTCLLLHGFMKNTEAVPAAEIRIASQRMILHESRLQRQAQN